MALILRIQLKLQRKDRSGSSHPPCQLLHQLKNQVQRKIVYSAIIVQETVPQSLLVEALLRLKYFQKLCPGFSQILLTTKYL
ncbi:hypothetical protein FGO68_gene16027 [Halteria grandinella]|uniref:Uncharacterized protein n=1 Tax=Halteria grandinella TaxID=5974 RepID=A0A8J8P092_HALGN|nr:hypothetical protein FGO68_gene16027 [Halteria grandinella]